MLEYQLTASQRHAVDTALQRRVTAISGPAGSGKTLVAATIAKRLCGQNALFSEAAGDSKVYFVTYTNELKRFVASQLRGAGLSVSETAGEPSDVTVLTVHAYLNAFMALQGEAKFFFNGRRSKDVMTRLDFLAAYVKEHAEDRQLAGCLADVDFLDEEIGWMLGRGIRRKPDYLKASRSGRKTPLSDVQREKVYGILHDYMTYLAKPSDELGNVKDFDDVGNQVLHYCAERGEHCIPLAEHLIVDEVQDLPKSWTDALRATVASSIVFVGDVSQSIYGRGFRWQDVAGESLRPIKLTEDFRNSGEIYRAARSLMYFDDSEVLDIPDEGLRRPEGPKPLLFFNADAGQQAETIVEQVQLFREQDDDGTVIVAFPKRVGEGFYNTFESFKKDPHVTITTLHSLKGLEADHVILADLDDCELNFNDEYTQEDTDRHLLFVGMTRARKTLVMMTATEKPAWILSEIDFNLIDVQADHNLKAHQYLMDILDKRRGEARKRFEGTVHEQVETEEQKDRAQNALGEMTGNADGEAEAAKTIERLERELQRKQEQLARNADEIRVLRAREQASQRAVSATSGDGGSEPARRFVDRAKVLILGAMSGVKKKDLGGIFKSIDLPKDAFEYYDYDNLHGGKFDANALVGSLKYSDIFVGQTPHKVRGTGGASSLNEFLRKNESELPKITFFTSADGTPKAISKTDLKEALYNSALYAAKNEI